METLVKRYSATHTLCEKLLIALLNANRPVTVAWLVANVQSVERDVAPILSVYVDAGLCARSRKLDGTPTGGPMVFGLTGVGRPVAVAATERPLLDPIAARKAYERGATLHALAGSDFTRQSVRELLEAEGVAIRGGVTSPELLTVHGYRHAAILAAVAHRGDCATVQDICGDTSVDRKRVYRALDWSRINGFVDVTNSGSNGGARKLYALTVEGKQVVELYERIDPDAWMLRYEKGEGIESIAGDHYTPAVVAEVLKSFGVHIRTMPK